MQEFHGILGGIAADGQIVDSELQMLRDWMNDHEYLANHWPFTETGSLLTGILADRLVSPEEHQVLLSWCGAFIDISSHKTLTGKVTGYGAILSGITAVAPEIRFQEKTFCLTGASAKASRQTIEDYIESLGGAVTGSIRQDLDYLVYCDAGQKCWAYACYGRKVESVMENRKAGKSTTLILAEVDIWDALADAGIEHRQRG
jgi:NAD-dependent DNA ligase